MNLQHLCSAPHVTVYFDSWNNWLYLEWEGALTLPAVQHACLAIAQCFVQYAYPRVLSNNAGLTSVEWNVTPWLGQHFIPYLALTGVEQIAWVHPAGLRDQDAAEYSTNRSAAPIVVTLFADLEDAVSWLQHTRPEYTSGCNLLPRPATPDARLTNILRAFEQSITATQASPESAPST